MNLSIVFINHFNDYKIGPPYKEGKFSVVLVDFNETLLYKTYLFLGVINLK